MVEQDLGVRLHRSLLIWRTASARQNQAWPSKPKQNCLDLLVLFVQIGAFQRVTEEKIKKFLGFPLGRLKGCRLRRYSTDSDFRKGISLFSGSDARFRPGGERVKSTQS
jgi:hypothetical protein